MAIKHVKTSNKPDGPDATLIQPSDWNEDHTGTLSADDVVQDSTHRFATDAEKSAWNSLVGQGLDSLDPSMRYFLQHCVLSATQPVDTEAFPYWIEDANFTVVTHTITASAGANGTITPSGSVNVIDGENQSFSITANTNYGVEDVLVDSVSVGAVTTYQFTNVTTSHTISASFAWNVVPVAPTGHSVDAGNTEVTIHPGTATGGTITGYTYYRTSNGTNPTKTNNDATGVATDNQVITGLTNGVAYKFVFTATNAIGESAESTVITVTPSSEADVTAPMVTAFVIPSTTNGLTITVSSFTATDAVGVTGYKITESATPPGAGDAGWSDSAPTTYDVTTNGSKTLYGYAKDAAGNVSTGVSDTTTVTTAPNAVTSLDATDGDTESVITWTASAADSTHSAATSYNLRWKLSTDGSYTTVTGVTSPYTKTGLTNGLTYDFIVDAINAAGTTASSSVQATPAVSTFTFPLTFSGTGSLESSLFNIVQPAGLTNASSGSTIDRSSDKLRFHVASNNASFAGQELQFKGVDPFPVSLATVKTITFDLTYPSQLVESRFIVCPTFPSAGNSFFNESNWMTMIIAPGTLGLNKKVSGVESNVHSASFTWVAGNTYAIKIEVDSTGTTIYVDNVSKISMSYGLTINSAYICMYYGHTSATFYDLLVDNFNIA